MQETQLNGESLDIVSENVSKLKELFPEIVTEDKIDFDKLKEVLGKYTEDDNERYNFTWKGKSAALRLAQTPSTGTLRPCKEESKNWDTTENLYIEGDNLEVLKLLQKPYHRKIKMIYIDPPYNTGKEFVYPDDYKDNLQNYLKISGQTDKDGMKLSTNTNTSGRYHTNWLNMIYPRLRLSWNLLSNDGVIFISIDDNELYNLKKILNEIFGEENFICSFVRKSGVSARLDSKFISIENDYVLLYAKNINELELNQKLMESDGSYKLKDKFFNERGCYKLNKLDRGSITYSKSLDYPIEAPDGTLIYPGGSNSNDGWCWRWSQEKLRWGIKNDFIVIKKGNKGWSVYFKQYEFVDNNNKRITRSIPYKNMLIKGFFNEYGSRMLKNLFDGSLYFDYPKPVELMSHLLSIAKSEKSIILDFFSGSCTTAHAVIQKNSEDNGNRRFIMVQIPESMDPQSKAFKDGYLNISEIGKERIRRAGDRILSEMNQNGQSSLNPNKFADLDIGFKVFKLDSSNLSKWDPEYDNLKQTLLDSVENIVPGRNGLDLVYEIMLKYGINLTLPIEEYQIKDKKFYSIGFGALIICLDDNLTSDLASELIKLKDELSPEIMRIVFKDNGFASDSDKTNIKETLKTNGIEEFVTI